MGKGFFKSLFIAGVPFGVIMGVILGVTCIALPIKWTLIIGISAGVISGLAFGLAISIFIQKQTKKFKSMAAEVTNGKEVIMDGGANHFKGAEGVGGWIYLTNEEFIFQSHSFNIQNHKLVIPVENITKVTLATTFGIIKNRLHIEMADGTTEKFVVNESKKWQSKINNVCNELVTSK